MDLKDERSSKGLSPTVIRLGWVSFLVDVSSEMLYPIVPIFLTTVLGAPVSAVGIIEGAAEAVASLFKSYFGALSDALGRRKPFVFSGYVFSALAKPLIAAAGGWPLVLVARSLDRLGKGMRTAPRDALLADSVPPESLGRAFGWHRGMDTLGAVVGPLIALWMLASFHGSLRWAFVAAVVPGLAGALLVLSVAENASPRAGGRSTTNPSAATMPLPASFVTYMLGWGLFSAANSSDMFLLLRSKEIGFSNTGTVSLYVLYNIIYACASPYLGGLADRIGRKHVVVGGLGVFAVVYAGFALASKSWHMWTLYAVYGLYVAATDGAGKALSADLVPRESRGRALGILGTVTGLASLAASVVAGQLWSRVGSWAAFAFGAAGALLGGIVIAATVSEKRRAR
ncbi:MAG: MFS transporter [Elusimicrobiota bacterium]